MKVPFPPPLYLLRRFPREDPSPVTVVRGYYAGEAWRERSSLARLALLAGLACWPIITAWAILRHTRRNGSAARARSGRGVLMQAYEQLRLGALYGLSPREYYGFELFRADKRRLAADYLNRYETGGELIRQMQRLTGRGAPAPMTDKERFTEACRAANLAVAPIVLVAAGGTLRVPAGSRPGGAQDVLLPESDLFLKPLSTSIRSTDSTQALSAVRWDYLGHGSYQGQGGEVLSADRLLQRIKDLSVAASYLVQPRLRNHPAIADLSNGALSSVTIQTFLNERDRPEIVAAVFHSAAGNNTLADNASLGGLIAAVDIDTGVLGPATDSGKRSHFQWWETHPDTGARIAGRSLPIWQEARALALRAHTAFSDHLVVGWDMALTAEGPFLLEGDPRGYVTLKQRAYGRPFGAMRYAELFAYHIQRASHRA